jgi:hypothetical protein
VRIPRIFELSKSLSKDLDEAFEKLHVPPELRESWILAPIHLFDILLALKGEAFSFKDM